MNDSPDRRPLKTREHAWSRRLALVFVNAGISPNTISMTGMYAAIIGGAALASMRMVEPGFGVRALWLLGAVLVQMRLLANMLDGMVAIETEQASPVGELYNEVPDRVSDFAILVGLGYALGGHPILGWGAACVAIFVAYVRAMVKAARAPQDFCGPMAKPHRMFLITIGALYCAFAPLSVQPEWNGHGIASLVLAVIIVGSLITSWRRLGHAVKYLGEKGVRNHSAGAGEHDMSEGQNGS